MTLDRGFKAWAERTATSIRAELDLATAAAVSNHANRHRRLRGVPSNHNPSWLHWLFATECIVLWLLLSCKCVILQG